MRMTMAESLNLALHEEMARDDSVLLIGQDVGTSGGLFGVSAELQTRFGSGRVIDAPISEAGLVGLAIGYAATSGPAIAEIQIMDFLTLAADQIVNHAAKMRYMSGGQLSVPLVIRGAVASGIGMGAQHSQMLASWFAHIPGLIVVMPSAPEDARGLLKSAIREPNPVVFFENRTLYGRRAEVAESEVLIPLGRAAVKRLGSDVTIVAAGASVRMVLSAAEQLAAEGIEAEVVDLRTLKPLDMSTITASVKKTGRLVAVDEAAPSCGVATEVCFLVATSGVGLKAPPDRITALDAPMPFSRTLEAAVLPGVSRVTRTILKMFEKADPSEWTAAREDTS